MRWVDVCGPPGVGKSTLCDPIWKPRDIKWNGEGARPEWVPFLDCVNRLMVRIRHHPSYLACASMVQRTIHKMSAVTHKSGDGIYVQTGFAQRGLGIGWRLDDQSEIEEFYQLMPVSVGVVLLFADVEMIKRRNVERGKDRSHMVAGMERPREIAAAVLRRRGVPLLEIDTRFSFEQSAARLHGFANGTADVPAINPARPCGQIPVLSTHPLWPRPGL